MSNQESSTTDKVTAQAAECREVSPFWALGVAQVIVTQTNVKIYRNAKLKSLLL